MNGTPRLRSAFPLTPRRKQNETDPGQSQKSRSNDNSNKGSTSTASPKTAGAPLIPLAVLDAPTQRFYVLSFYLGLTAWRLFDYSRLISNESDSLWLFMKWVAIDGVSLYGLPGLRVPWLEWSSSTMTIIFLFHAIINGLLMFRVPIPLEIWFLALARMVYDREISVSEGRVKPASLLHNPSLIQGKQIIHILPEGSAVLNPDHKSFCLDSMKTSAKIPLVVNQTNPTSIEILRVDLETNVQEIIVINAKEAKKLKKQADKDLGNKNAGGLQTLHYTVRKTGLYCLQKVVDESNLEVQSVLTHTFVVNCPSGSVKAAPQNKCRGELSDFYFHIEAVPPLKVRYSKTVNREDQSYVSLTVHPENVDSPPSRQLAVGAESEERISPLDVSWARSKRIDIPVNETLGVSGGWQYSLDEIHDGCGNVVNYTRPEDSGGQRPSGGSTPEQIFLVHERPKAVLDECSPQNPMKVAKGNSRRLPVWLNPTGQHSSGLAMHSIEYSFQPQQQIATAGDFAAQGIVEKISLRPNSPGPEIREPGLYALLSISNEFCDGEVLEPSSCLLSNPPEPDLSVTSERIPHQCAGNSIGLRLNLDLIGSPPFQISYNVHRRGGRTVPRVEKINSLRTQLEFRPREAGFYAYEFIDITDSVYEVPRSLKHKQLRLEQDVRPTAWARFQQEMPHQKACIEEPVSFEIYLTGESPWTLEYDLIHDGKRNKYQNNDITSNIFILTTPSLNAGGQYSLSLTSVTDASGCKIFLEQEAKIDVRLQRPRASFGQIEGRRVIHSLQSQKVALPVRLTGEPPWNIGFSRINDASQKIHTRQLHASNDVLEVDSQDVYQIKNVHDKFCPGTVDHNTNEFEVTWIPRPTVQLAKTSVFEERGDVFHKRPVCEGDQDSVDIVFTGNPPYNLRYDVNARPSNSAFSVSSKEETIGLHTDSIKMQTSQAGYYEYKILELGDQHYDQDRRKLSPLNIHQIVNDRPSAKFANGGRTYNYCKEEAVGDEVIPIILTGKPPFAMELGIRHHATMKMETINVPYVESNRYDFRLPHAALSLGSHLLMLKKVQDSNGCQRITEVEGPVTRVNVVDVPSISPMEPNADFCVGDRISYTLAGVPPFNIYYVFEDVERRASSSTNNFRRIAERPGNFTIIAVSDKASSDTCRARVKHTKIIHELPSVRISKGRTAQVDIHEGGEAEILFEFGGSPPFEFTYTRSTNTIKGKQPRVLETKTETSHDFSKLVRVSEEGTYEVVSIKDKFCVVSSQRRRDHSEQHLLTF